MQRQRAVAVEVANINLTEPVSLNCGAVHIEHKVDLEGNRIASILRCGTQILGVEYNGQTYSAVLDTYTHEFLGASTNPFVQKIVQADLFLNDEQLTTFVSQYIED